MVTGVDLWIVHVCIVCGGVAPLVVDMYMNGYRYSNPQLCVAACYTQWDRPDEFMSPYTEGVLWRWRFSPGSARSLSGRSGSRP